MEGHFTISRRAATSRLVVAMIAVGFAAVLLFSTAGHAARSAACFATGPKYKYAGGSTTKYDVAAAGVSCSFAKAWVTRLVRQKPVKTTLSTGQAAGALRGPKGWNCYAADPAGRAAIPKVAYAGACAPSSAPYNKKIAWSPIL